MWANTDQCIYGFNQSHKAREHIVSPLTSILDEVEHFGGVSGVDA